MQHDRNGVYYPVSSSSLDATFAGAALPYNMNEVEWNRSTINQPSNSPSSTQMNGFRTFESVPFNSNGGFMFGEQQHVQYRSVLVPRNDSMALSGFNPLRDDHYQARAVDVHQSRPQTNWFAPEQLQQQSQYTAGAFAGFGSTSKFASNDYHMENEYVPTQNMKELSMPRLESLLVSVPASLSLELPKLPLFLEATSFSCPAAVCGAQKCFQTVQECMKQAGTIVAMQKQYQLTCSATVGVSCAEFNVRCYSGHYRSCNATTAATSLTSTSADGTWYTIEFQRRTGCSYGTMQLFKHVVRTLLAALGEQGVDCPIALEGPKVMIDDAGGEPGSPTDVSTSEDDMSDISGLAMPSMIRTDASCIPATLDFPTQPDVSLYDSLLDLLTSTSEQSQLEGLNSLALCLDGSNPRAGELLQEVARKLKGDSIAQVRVKQVAARLIAQASSMPGVAAQVVKHCLPSVLATIMSGSISTQDQQPTIAAAHGLDAQKSLLRSCVTLSASIPTALTDTEGSNVILANSRLKRELLRLTGAEDQDVRALAVQTIRAIQV